MRNPGVRHDEGLVNEVGRMRRCRRMKLVGKGQEMFVFIGGLSLPRTANLGDGIALRPVTRRLDPEVPMLFGVDPWEVQVIKLFLPSVTAELEVRAEHERALVAKAWNTLWDMVLIGGLFNCETSFNIQSNVSAEDYGPAAELMLTNFHFRGLVPKKPRAQLTEDDVVWLEANVERSRSLLPQMQYCDALHALASYRWHPNPRIQLAVLWAGIEGLFRVDTEQTFRLSLYVARFLSPGDDAERLRLFRATKVLYRRRSEAVHGTEIKGVAHDHVRESADLLCRLVKQCIAAGAIPDAEALAP